MSNKNNSERWAIILYAILAALNTVSDRLFKAQKSDTEGKEGYPQRDVPADGGRFRAGKGQRQKMQGRIYGLLLRSRYSSVPGNCMGSYQRHE